LGSLSAASAARVRFSSKPWGLQAGVLGANDAMYSPLHTMVELPLGRGVYGMNIVDRNGLGRKYINIRKAWFA
jgi:hypothetical protein